jgi:hypothetical protein
MSELSRFAPSIDRRDLMMAASNTGSRLFPAAARPRSLRRLFHSRPAASHGLVA